MKNAVLVIGYNNTRINDVKKIREKAKRCLNALTILCKKDPSELDKTVVDLTIDVGLEDKEENVNIVLQRCLENDIKVVGVLPFSDHGTQLGAALASHLNLPGADPKKISAALDKQDFREKELSIDKPEKYCPVPHREIRSLEELQKIFLEFNAAIFLKPMAEGNSRGCIEIKDYQGCLSAWEEVKKYLPGGIVAEKLIENAKEYSVENIAGYSWITEKITTNTQYRAESQHIVPAPLSQNEEDLLHDGAKFMAELCGYNGGAYHNEIFLLNSRDSVIAVEPNLRPAGAKIWDLAAYAFEEFDPWTYWVRWAAGKIDNLPKKINKKFFAGIRFVTAKKNGKLEKLGIESLDKLSFYLDANFIELFWLKKVEDNVTSFPRDNADFLGYVIAKSTDYKTLVSILEKAEEMLSNSCIIK